MKLLILLFLSIFTFSCSTHKQSSNQTNSFIEIKYGSSGGYTGMTNEYLLLQNGKIYKVSNEKLNFINQIEDKEIKNIEKQIVELNFKDIKLYENGNMTYFIEIQTSTYKNRITWTDQTQNDSIKQFYKSLVKLLK
ncbi:MAG: hypothetical protein BWY22_00491 [Bacteroidetes bacterium ADurb.Bin217]|nr:MAG: hypothetical protein BWY22_00491 [Bacteroidetes bacterium ADurb.Bin217]